MLDEIRENNVTKLIATVIILLLAGIALIWLKSPNIKAYLYGNTQFETLKPEEIKSNILVDVSVDTNFGACMEEYVRSYLSDARTTGLYYVIWTGDNDAEEYKYMAIKVPVSEESTMRAIEEATYNYEYIDPVTYSGVINRMTPEETQYFEEYFLDGGWTKEEVEEQTLPYYINVGESTDGIAGSATMVFVVMVVIGFPVFLICIWKP